MPAGRASVASQNHRLPKMAAVQEHAGEAATLLKALANDQRLLVLCSLLDGPLSVGEINERVELSQSALSQHLAVLRTARIVTTRRESQTIYYALSEGPALKVMEVLYEAFCAPKAPAPKAGRSRSPRRC
jgi:DNA-binding transcriptional ArsR family regulator